MADMETPKPQEIKNPMGDFFEAQEGKAPAEKVRDHWEYDLVPEFQHKMKNAKSVKEARTIANEAKAKFQELIEHSKIADKIKEGENIDLETSLMYKSKETHEETGFYYYAYYNFKLQKKNGLIQVSHEEAIQNLV